MRYTNLLFDLDGTLTDPKPGITKSVQYALRKFGIEEDNLDVLEPFIGPPLMDSFREGYGFTEAEAREAVEAYREYFKDRGLYENALYPGMTELLDLLRDQGRTLMVATSKPTVFAEKILSYFQIDRYFVYVCGSNLDGTRTDKAEVIQHIFAEKGLDPAATVMIGDRKHDILGARRCGIDSIGIGYGYGSEEELANAGPTYYADTVAALQALFRTG